MRCPLMMMMIDSSIHPIEPADQALTTTELSYGVVVAGGLGSPRQYAGRGDHPPGTLHHQYPPPPPPHPASLTSPHHQQQQQQQQPPQSLQQPTHHHQHQHPMMYQQDSQYCYDQTGLQLAFNGADRGRGPPPHLQGGK